MNVAVYQVFCRELSKEAGLKERVIGGVAEGATSVGKSILRAPGHVVEGVRGIGHEMTEGARAVQRGALRFAHDPVEATSAAAGHVGRETIETAKDTAKATGHIFNPRSWGHGARGFTDAHGHDVLGAGSGLVTAGFTGLDAAHVAKTKNDPETGRHIGGAERTGKILAHVGSDLTAYHSLHNRKWLRAGLAFTGARELADRGASMAGRAVDHVRGAPSSAFTDPVHATNEQHHVSPVRFARGPQ